MKNMKEAVVFTIVILLVSNFMLATFMITRMFMASWLYGGYYG